jgi:hypothetical protein
MDEAELTAEIAVVSTAITHIMKAGQEYTIDSGGSSRRFRAADLNDLKRYRQELYAELRTIQGTSGLQLGAGW